MFWEKLYTGTQYYSFSISTYTLEDGSKTDLRNVVALIKYDDGKSQSNIINQSLKPVVFQLNTCVILVTMCKFARKTL
jgi:hypothetical protein